MVGTIAYMCSISVDIVVPTVLGPLSSASSAWYLCQQNRAASSWCTWVHVYSFLAVPLTATLNPSLIFSCQLRHLPLEEFHCEGNPFLPAVPVPADQMAEILPLQVRNALSICAHSFRTVITGDFWPMDSQDHVTRQSALCTGKGSEGSTDTPIKLWSMCSMWRALHQLLAWLCWVHSVQKG